jgi:hypothetical protein
MELDKNNNIVSHNANGEYVSIPKDDVGAMDSILNTLRDANQDKRIWNKLSGDDGYNDFYHKDSK